ncbi:hypothetical protein NMG60_11036034 [Bertholletia excelsa]
MEVEKRKRAEEEEAKEKRSKVVVGEDKAMAADDDEVEEFFAILRRMHAAVRYFDKGEGRGRRRPSAGRWMPSFEREDFEEPNGVKVGERDDEDSGLDLNAEPTADWGSV